MFKKIIMVIALLLSPVSVVAAEMELSTKETKELIKKLQASLKDKECENKCIDKKEKGFESFFYMGLGSGGGQGNHYIHETTNAGVETITTTSFDATMASVKFGYSTKKNNRIELVILDIDAKRSSTVTDSIQGVDLNWEFVFDLKDISVSPFILLGLGSYTWQDSTAKGFGAELEGGSFNFGFGGLYKMGTDFELEFAYQAKVIGWEDYILASSTSLFSEAHGMSFLYLGLNYHF